MNASNKFGHGLGKRKLELIIKEYRVWFKKIKKRFNWRFNGNSGYILKTAIICK